MVRRDREALPAPGEARKTSLTATDHRRNAAGPYYGALRTGRQAAGGARAESLTAGEEAGASKTTTTRAEGLRKIGLEATALRLPKRAVEANSQTRHGSDGETAS